MFGNTVALKIILDLAIPFICLHYIKSADEKPSSWLCLRADTLCTNRSDYSLSNSVCVVLQCCRECYRDASSSSCPDDYPLGIDWARL